MALHNGPRAFGIESVTQNHSQVTALTGGQTRCRKTLLVQHSGAESRHLIGLFVGQALDGFGMSFGSLLLIEEGRIRRGYPVYVGPDLDVSLQRRSKSCSGVVGASPAQGGGTSVLSDGDEAGYHQQVVGGDHRAGHLFQRIFQQVGITEVVGAEHIQSGRPADSRIPALLVEKLAHHSRGEALSETDNPVALLVAKYFAESRHFSAQLVEERIEKIGGKFEVFQQLAMQRL